MDIALYSALLVLAARNIWVVVPHHYQELRMLPSPAFYMFTVIALILRLLFIIGHWTDDNVIIFSIDWVQQGAKLCVGIVQDWITLELAIRIHISKSEFAFSRRDKNKL